MMNASARALLIEVIARSESPLRRGTYRGARHWLSMFIMHVALQGCLRSGPIDYGATADTGGHIRYLLELVEATARAPGVQQCVVTRGFHAEELGPEYALRRDRLSCGTPLYRIFDGTRDYLSKEGLWAEHDRLADSLADLIDRLPTRPDLIHAHYADAGAVAQRVKARTGIDFVFTGHSLGAVKKAVTPCGQDTAEGERVLSRRIRDEETAIAAASKIIASSRDEAERQYGYYAMAKPARIKVIPPGCDLEAFRHPAETDIAAKVDRFLTDPSKAPIVALARPVRKKNLAGLVKMFGETPDLRRRANLIIFAGVRDDLREQSEESRDVLSELLYLVDRYDLYGQIALPKQHDPNDVPAIYAYAAKKGGVFVNAALNEPFGLTFLEAAAAGLPVVATNQGGPNDILERCGNGRLVDPLNPQDIASACLELIEDDEAWRRCAEAGRRRSAYYNWDRHVRDYLAEMRDVVAPAQTPAIFARPRKVLLASDIDNTLIGDRAALSRFKKWRDRADDVAFAIATGRSLHSAIDILRQWETPVPDVLITSVGSEIYYRIGDGFDVVADEDWALQIGGAWDVAAVRAIAARYPSLIPQPRTEQRAFKASYFAHPDDPAIAAFRFDLARRGLSANIVYSHDRYLDVLPSVASKGHALDFIARRIGISPLLTIAAGDSGNDTEMLRRAARSIVVGNHSHELTALRGLPNTYFAVSSYADGIVEGIERGG